ncbi:hypothetical protein [Demequina sp.]|uniref:hypothetical protein n=1 Tax=Demequina sp. TaxID=2050685 RepID=UPI003A84E624
MASKMATRRAMVLAGALVCAGCATSAGPLLPDLGGADAAAHDTATVLAASTVSPSPQPSAAALSELIAMDGTADADGTLGAGCHAAEGEPLTDGDWYGIVTDYSVHGVTVDLACVYAQGTDQYAAFAQAESDDPSSYVVVNDVIEERSMRVSESTQIRLEHKNWEPVGPHAAQRSLDPDEVGTHVGVWLRIVDGQVDEIVQPATQGAQPS